MKPQNKLATTQTPDGGEMELYQHDRDFSIKINGLELMNSRQHESEQELARLGCAASFGPRSALRADWRSGHGLYLGAKRSICWLPTRAVVVSELLPAVVEWNRQYLGALNGQPLDDKRVALVSGDIFELISQSVARFDAILLDVDIRPQRDDRFGQSTVSTARLGL